MRKGSSTSRTCAALCDTHRLVVFDVLMLICCRRAARAFAAVVQCVAHNVGSVAEGPGRRVFLCTTTQIAELDSYA